MDGVVLVASTCPSGHVESSTLPQAQWCETTSEWPVPGRFAFFTFKITLPFDCTDWFPGLEQHYDWDKHELFVAGTFDKWDSVCYALLNRNTPHDLCRVYREIYTILSDFGYTMRGTKSTQAKRFYLK
jgi:hypothetical protein